MASAAKHPTNYEAGHQAELRAANWLKTKGYEILNINWKTPAAEIDIVAKKDKCIFFVEVKYRKNSAQGDGLDYITSSKIRHMQRASQVWMAQNKWAGIVSLAAIAADSMDNYHLIDNIDIV